ncbi:hypothetical protein PROFUN_07130 [Planoprotostelium fungivorum]|uniref:Uncharacterized protein n=1 Tax=Planoprotostelium fungivorum TaxID=1890364 RepID=A0A2P6NMK0_9EUKA|nr:hypothetical protein PROFUN_07130 [Planoprotostelium fungivorum]
MIYNEIGNCHFALKIYQRGPIPMLSGVLSMSQDKLTTSPRNLFSLWLTSPPPAKFSDRKLFQSVTTTGNTSNPLSHLPRRGLWAMRFTALIVCALVAFVVAAPVQENGAEAVDANPEVLAMLERLMKRGSKGDWEFCTTSSDCSNNCCSKQYSGDGKLKCTPGGSQCVNGGSSTGSSTGNGGGSSGGFTVPRNAWPRNFSMDGTPFAPGTGGEASTTWCGEHFDVTAGIVSLPLLTWSKAYGSSSSVTYFSNAKLWQTMVNDICGLEVIVTGPGGTYKAVIGDTNMYYKNLDHNLHLAGKMSGMKYTPTSMSQVPKFHISGYFTGKKYSIKGGKYPYYY